MENTKTSKQLKNKGGLKQRIVICGSMSFYGDILESQQILEAHGIPAIVPEAEDEHISTLSTAEFDVFKQIVSYRYLKKIRDLATVAILVINKDKNGIKDYIGPNSFAEIAVAFAQRKKVFLLQGMPEVYEEELQAWGVISLDGNLDGLLTYYSGIIEQQLTFFDEEF